MHVSDNKRLFVLRQSKSGEHHLVEPGSNTGDDGQVFGRVTAFAEESPLVVGGVSALMGVLQVAVESCTPPPSFNAIGKTCFGRGCINPGQDSHGQGPLPLLREGDQGSCTGVAMSSGNVPVAVACRISIRNSLQSRDLENVDPPSTKSKAGVDSAETRTFRIVLRTDKGEPIANSPFFAEAEGCAPFYGRVDEKGVAEFKMAARKCEIRFPNIEKCRKVAGAGAGKLPGEADRCSQ
jgi:hypothetical protein